MLDLQLPRSTDSFQQTFYANSSVIGEAWHSFVRPRGCSFSQLLILSGGGVGGAGAVGAASTAGGGGGGASGQQSSLRILWLMLPDVIYFSIGKGGIAASNGIDTIVSISPDTVAQNCIMRCIGGTKGDPGGAGTGGNGGTTTAFGAISTYPLICAGQSFNLASQAGVVGGSTGAGFNIALPATGLIVTGGSSGAGLRGANLSGNTGGQITGAGIFPTLASVAGGTTAPTGGSLGASGMKPVAKLCYFYGGNGGSSSGLSAVPTGSTGGNGGNGAYGCGGGGGGGGFTGSVAALGGLGGDGIIFVNSW